MKLSAATIAVLKNFASIHQGIVINPGNIISSMATNKTVLGVAEVAETFDQQIAIYDLPEFLNILGMFKEPTIDVKAGRQVVIHEGKSAAYYTFAEPSTMAKSPKGLVENEQPIVTFELPAKTLQAVMRATSVLALPEVAIKGSNGVLSIRGVNSKSSSANVYEYELGETAAKFEAFYLVERFVMMPRDYKVELRHANVKFEALAQSENEYNIKYWVGHQDWSTFPK